MKYFILIFFIMNQILFSSVEVNIGGYIFPPYVTADRMYVKGYTIDLINELNKIQDKYHFIFNLTAPKRRYSDFGNKFHIIFFEDINWGWNEKTNSFETIDFTIEDYEVFFALKKHINTKNYFENYKNKKLVLVRGFHYPIVNFDTNEKLIQERLDVVFTNHSDKLVDYIIRERAEIGLINITSLNKLKKDRKEYYNKIFISSQKLNIYKLSAIISNQSPITKKEFEKLIKKIEEKNFFKKI